MGHNIMGASGALTELDVQAVDVCGMLKSARVLTEAFLTYNCLWWEQLAEQCVYACHRMGWQLSAWQFDQCLRRASRAVQRATGCSLAISRCLTVRQVRGTECCWELGLGGCMLLDWWNACCQRGSQHGCLLGISRCHVPTA